MGDAVDDDIIDPTNPLDPPSWSPTGPGDNTPSPLPSQEWPNIDDLVIEDGEPVESIYAEKQYRLLTEPLYVSWKPAGGRTFVVFSNVGLFYSKKPPLVPDVMLSLDYPVGRDLSRKENNSYFTWIVGKPPEVAIEFVSDRRGGEEDYKKDEYESIPVPYYVIYDPDNHLDGGILRVFALRGGVYRPAKTAWLPKVGLGLTLWDGVYEEWSERNWLRWCDRDGFLIPTGQERTEQAEQQTQRAKANQAAAPTRRARTATRRAGTPTRRATGRPTACVGDRPGDVSGESWPSIAVHPERRPTLRVDVRLVRQISGVLPGMATGGTVKCVSQVRSLGMVSSFEFSACSHETRLPVYADMRPRMAVSVHSATCFSSLSGLPERMLSIRSVCSCT